MSALLEASYSQCGSAPRGLSLGLMLVGKTRIFRKQDRGARRSNSAFFVLAAVVSSTVGIRWIQSRFARASTADSKSMRSPQGKSSIDVSSMRLQKDSQNASGSEAEVGTGEEFMLFDLEVSRDEVESSIYCETGYLPSVAQE